MRGSRVRSPPGPFFHFYFGEDFCLKFVIVYEYEYIKRIEIEKMNVSRWFLICWLFDLFIFDDIRNNELNFILIIIERSNLSITQHFYFFIFWEKHKFLNMFYITFYFFSFSKISKKKKNLKETNNRENKWKKLGLLDK